MAVTSVSSVNADISVANGTTTPVLTLNSGTGANQIVKRDANGNISVFILKATLSADITTALQSALNTYKEVVIDGSPGQYLINATLTMPSGVLLRGINDAKIACGSTPTGNLASAMQYIEMFNNNCTVTNITFLPPSAGFGVLDYGAACIFITGERNTIDSCTFTFDFAMSSDVDAYAVWVSTETALYNRITNNNCTTVGIHYAEYGSSYVFCDGNYILNACTDGLQGVGNAGPTAPCKGNIVSNNIVIGSGFSAIEDQQYIDSTIISNNIFLDSGNSSNAPARGSGMAISAVGTNTLVTGNVVAGGFLLYGIEVFGAGDMQIEDNIITMEKQDPQYGIFINHTNVPVPPDPPIPGRLNATNIINNSITDCATAIESQGDYNVYLNIQGNKIKDFVNNGINVATDGGDACVNILNNTVILTKPNTLPQYEQRIAIQSFSPSPTTTNWFFRIGNNNVIYESTAGGGDGYETGIFAGHAGTLVENNIVNSNNIQINSTIYIYTYWTGGGNVVNAVKYLNNKSFGTYAKVDLSTFTNTIQIGNNWTNGATEVLFDIIKTATNANYTITSAGLLIKLPVITAARNVTLPSPANYVGGTIKIWNQNTAAFNWSFNTSGGTILVKNAANANISTLTNQTWYILLSDGTNWNRTN